MAKTISSLCVSCKQNKRNAQNFECVGQIKVSSKYHEKLFGIPNCQDDKSMPKVRQPSDGPNIVHACYNFGSKFALNTKPRLKIMIIIYYGMENFK